MFYITQAGDKLYRVSTAGVATELTLPTGVTIDATKRPQFAVLGRNVFVGYSPSVNLWVDGDATVRPMVPRAPASQPHVAAGSGTGLTGAYRIKQQFLVLHPTTQAILARSPCGPQSNSVTLSNQDLSATAIALSSESEVGASRIARTVAGGELFFEMLDLDGNTQTSFTTSLSDASLSLLPEQDDYDAPPGTLPGSRLRLLVSWKNRLWAVSDDSTERDNLIATDDGLHYAWTLTLPIHPVGRDEFGITAIMPRRDELVIGRRSSLVRIAGSSEDDFEAQVIVEEQACLGQGITIRDTCYFMGFDGVYSYGAGGIKNLSKQRAHDWFNSDTYFNRAEFANAQFSYDPVLDCVRIQLAAPSQTTLNRWVDYYIASGKWLGPHATDEFTPVSGALLLDADSKPKPVFGSSNGFLYSHNGSNKRDGAATAIDWQAKTLHTFDDPRTLKMMRFLWVASAVQAAGTMTITPTVGWLDASAQSSISHDMTLGRQKLRRLGVGELLQLTFRQNIVNQDAELYGYELDWYPVSSQR